MLRSAGAHSQTSRDVHAQLRRGRDLEKWGEGIRMLEEWFPLDRPEPRLSRVRWMRHIGPLARVLGIYRYQLGN